MYAFSAFDNQKLQFLWDWSQHNLTIHAGKLFFSRNPQLCKSEIRKMWLKTGIKEKFVEEDFRNNGISANCKCLNYKLFSICLEPDVRLVRFTFVEMFLCSR